MTIPDKVSLLRSFEIDNIEGNWGKLELRKHRIRLISDSISEQTYTQIIEKPNLTLDSNNVFLETTFKPFQAKELYEAYLISEQRKLTQELDELNNINKTISDNKKIKVGLNDGINKYKNEVVDLENNLKAVTDNPLMNWCKLTCKVNEDVGVKARLFMGKGMVVREGILFTHTMVMDLIPFLNFFPLAMDTIA